MATLDKKRKGSDAATISEEFDKLPEVTSHNQFPCTAQ
jgi:hypothetical protein